MYEDIINDRKEDVYTNHTSIEMCSSNHTWVYPKIKTKAGVIVCFHCPDCGHRWIIDV